MRARHPSSYRPLGQAIVGPAGMRKILRRSGDIGHSAPTQASGRRSARPRCGDYRQSLFRGLEMSLLFQSYLPAAAAISTIQVVENLALFAQRGQLTQLNMKLIYLELAFFGASVEELLSPFSDATEQVAVAHVAYFLLALLVGFVMKRQHGLQIQPDGTLPQYPPMSLVLNITLVLPLMLWSWWIWRG